MVTGMHLTPLGDRAVLLEPGEGLDPSEPDAYLVPVLDYLQQRRAVRVIYDLEAVALVDDVYLGWLTELARACSAIGVRMVVVNMRPEVAYTLAMILDGPPPFACARDVDRARS